MTGHTARRHLAVVGQADARANTRIAVIASEHALLGSSADDAAVAITETLRSIGCKPVRVQAGKQLAEELLSSGARLAIPATLDLRLADGTLHEICGDLGIECLGSAPDVLLLCADKALTAAQLHSAAIPVPRQRRFTRGAIVAAGIGAVLPRAVQAIASDRLIIKPRWGCGGGAGVKRVSATDAPAAISNTFCYGDEVVVEPVLEGTEYTVLVTGSSDEPMAVGLAEVTYTSEDPMGAAWARAYSPVKDIKAAAAQAATGMARRAARALGISDLGTVDVIVDEDGTPWIIDVNTGVDWQPGKAVDACLQSRNLTRQQLLAGLLDDLGARLRAVA